MTAFSPGRVGLVALCALVACARRTPIPVAPDQPVVSDSDSAILQATHPLDWPVSDSVVGPPRRLEPDDIPPRSNGELLRNADLHQALDDVRRLGLVSSFQEMRRGLLRLGVGQGFATGKSVIYNFRNLHTAYRKSIDFYGEGILELWRDGQKLGEFTGDGLLLGPEYRRPH